MKLTPKQEKFAQVYVETSNASEAYRQAYDASRMKQESIAVKASELLSSGNVTVRVQQIREELAKASQIGLKELIEELEQARQAALGCESPQSSAAVAATMGKAKLLGLDKQVIDHTSSDGSMSRAKLSDDELERKIAELMGR